MGGAVRAMVQQDAVQRASAAYARDMERLSAKESLLLAASLLKKLLGEFASIWLEKIHGFLMQNCRHEDALNLLSIVNEIGMENTMFDMKKALFCRKLSCFVIINGLGFTMMTCYSFVKLKDAGGFEACSRQKATEMQRIDVMERITGLERLNPTPRPTTSPYFEGKWILEWFGPDTPGLVVLRILSERLPTTLANITQIDLLLKDGTSKVVAFMSLLNSVSTKLIVVTKLTPEGPLRMKEEYVEATLESPNIIEETIPEQVKSVLAQASGAVQQLPIPLKDLLSNGLTIPLSRTFQRIFMISYLDEEILIIRDADGVPSVLTRLDQVLPAGVESTTEYVS